MGAFEVVVFPYVCLDSENILQGSKNGCVLIRKKVYGVAINYSKPSQKEYFEIVFELARKAGIKMGEDELKLEANKWELSHGGISGRTAQQFINHLMGLQA